MKKLASALVLASLFAYAVNTNVVRAQDDEEIVYDELDDVNYLAPIIQVSGLRDVSGKRDDDLHEPVVASNQRASKLNCDSLCGPDRGCGCQNKLSLWAATADALLLNRSDPSPAVLAFNTANPAENLNASDFNFGVHTGFDLTLLRHIGCNSSLELRYFGIDHWRDTLSATTTPGQLLQINAAVPVFTFSGSGVNAGYSSALHNAEINGRRRVNDWLTVLSGFRYTELDERASANLVGPGLPFNYSTSTRNRLYGFQLGGEAWLWSRKFFSLAAVGKAGVYGNQSAQGSSINTAVVTLPATGQSGHTAFIGEAGLNAALQLTDQLALRGGYRLLWLDRVALASEQLAVSDFANGTGYSGSGNVFYQGAFAGFEVAY